MPIELTKEQQAQLDRETSRPAAVRDPRCDVDYVLLPAGEYEELLKRIGDDDEQRAASRGCAHPCSKISGRWGMKPGEIYFADLYEAGVRPIVVVSRESLNRGGYVLAVPVTASHFDRRSRLPNCVPFDAGQFGLTTDCVAQCEAALSVEQVQIDKSRGLVGTLDDASMRQIIRAIGYVIASDCEPI